MARYQHRDHYYRKANERGLPSRAAFKLEELLKRFKLVGAGGRVVDLGCAPGGWLAILSGIVGNNGRVAGIDLVSCPQFAANVITISGDVAERTVRIKAAQALGGSADLITSDLAPKLSGIADRDQARTREVLEAALDLAHDLLKPGGAMVAKVFMGGGFDEVRALFVRDFARVETVRTRASRPGSSELYLVAQGFLPQAK
jgi:23S rRNA (uridine2552-2'-O)-methyltransferase